MDEYLHWLESKIEEMIGRIDLIKSRSEAVTLMEHRESLASYSLAKHMYEKLVVEGSADKTPIEGLVKPTQVNIDHMVDWYNDRKSWSHHERLHYAVCTELFLTGNESATQMTVGRWYKELVKRLYKNES